MANVVTQQGSSRIVPETHTLEEVGRRPLRSADPGFTLQATIRACGADFRRAACLGGRPISAPICPTTPQGDAGSRRLPEWSRWSPARGNGWRASVTVLPSSGPVRPPCGPPVLLMEERRSQRVPGAIRPASEPSRTDPAEYLAGRGTRQRLPLSTGAAGESDREQAGRVGL